MSFYQAPEGRKVQVSFSYFSIGPSTCLSDSAVIDVTGDTRYVSGSTRYCGGNAYVEAGGKHLVLRVWEGRGQVASCGLRHLLLGQNVPMKRTAYSISGMCEYDPKRCNILREYDCNSLQC